MTPNEIQALIDRSLFADLGYIDGGGRPAIRRVFCVWHRGIGSHLISTNTSSGHARLLSESPSACLYFGYDSITPVTTMHANAAKNSSWNNLSRSFSMSTGRSLHDRAARLDDARHVGEVARDDHGVVRLGEVAELREVLLR